MSSNHNEERYNVANAVIDDVNNLAAQDTIYDQWPIDDKYRDIALCAVHAMRTVGNANLNTALDELPLAGKRELVETVAATIELRADQLKSVGENVHCFKSTLTEAVMAKKSLSIDEVGKGEVHPFVEETIERTTAQTNAYESIPIIMREEALVTIASEIHQAVRRDWIYESEITGASPEERIMGAVETALDVLQNGTRNLPPFKLVVAHPTYYNEAQSYAYTNDGNIVPRVFEVGQVIDISGSVADGDLTLTSSFANVYDSCKRRMWAASRDLFDSPSRLSRNEDE